MKKQKHCNHENQTETDRNTQPSGSGGVPNQLCKVAEASRKKGIQRLPALVHPQESQAHERKFI